MSMFPLFSRAHTEEPNDWDMAGSLPLNTPWEIHHQPTVNKSPTTYWQFGQQQQQPTSQFGLVQEKYYNGQSPWLLPKSSELEPTDEEYLGSVNPGSKKLIHNARERNRRKILKVLYSKLRSLLPNQNPKRKLSIPNTVCRALKYIPELRNEIKKLTKERAKLLDAIKRSVSVNSLVTSKSASNTGAEGLPDFRHSPPPPPPPAAFDSPDPIIVKVDAALWSSQIVVTIYNCRVGVFFSALLVMLEKEGLEMLDASTFLCEDKVYYNLHLEIIAGSKVDTDCLEKRLQKLLSDEPDGTVG